MLTAGDAWAAVLPLIICCAGGFASGYWYGKGRGYADALADVRAEIARRARRDGAA